MKLDGGKLVLAGACASGKTTLILKLVQGTYRDDVITSITAAFTEHEFNHSNKKVVYRIWDTAGQERFKAITPAYFRGANTILLCFDLSSEDSFNELDHWM